MDFSKRQIKALKVAIWTLVGLFGFGTILFHWLEDWSWIESFYFTVVTLTTVGYGDISPSNDGTRLAVAFFILIGVAIVGAIISNVGGAFIKQRVRHRLDEDKED